MALSDYFKRVLFVAIGSIALIVVLTTVMSFVKVDQSTYGPYMYFIIALGILGVFLSPYSLSIID